MSLESDGRGRPEPGRQNKCYNCGSFISPQFARVFGDNEDRAHACIDCSTLHSLREGEAGETD